MADPVIARRLRPAQFQPVERRLAGQGCAFLVTARLELAGKHGQHRVVAQFVMVVEIFVTERDGEQPLADQGRHLMLDQSRIAGINETPGDPPLVAKPWPPPLPRRHATDHYGRRRRLERLRVRLWKRELQRLADDIGLAVEVDHLPPGTSKWNKIEHRLFSFITQNWRAKPLVSYKVIIDLIAATTTTTGLKVHCELDTTAYPKGLTVSDAEMDAINIQRAEFHGEWNYNIRPTSQADRAVDS